MIESEIFKSETWFPLAGFERKTGRFRRGNGQLLPAWRSFLPFLASFVFGLIFSCHSASSRNGGEKDEVLHILATGDVMVHAPQLTTAWENECQCYNFYKTFHPIRSLVQEADLAIANLETTLPGPDAGYSGYPQFGSPDSLIPALRDAGFDILTTANNHSVDKGLAGIQRTIRILDRNGMLHLGTYESQESYQKKRIFLVEKKGIRLALLNYTYGTNGIPVPSPAEVNLIEKERIAEDLTLARELGPDAIVVLYHFGKEYLRFPDNFQKDMVDFAIQHGAQIVLGGHPHVIQPYRLFQATDETGFTGDRLVIYSMGNLVSNQRRRFTDGGILFRFQLVRREEGGVRIAGVSPVPVWVQAVFQGAGKGHYILPVDENGVLSIAKDMHPDLNAKDRWMLDTFLQDTFPHLEASREEVQKQLGFQETGEP